MTRAEEGLAAPLIGRRDRFDQDAGCLLAGRCQDCQAQRWPRRAMCPECGGGRIVEVRLAQFGTLTTWSRVWVPIGDIDPPYVVGMVDLDGVSVLGHIRNSHGDPDISCRVSVVIGEGARAPLPFWFEQASSGDETPGRGEKSGLSGRSSV